MFISKIHIQKQYYYSPNPDIKGKCREEVVVDLIFTMVVISDEIGCLTSLINLDDFVFEWVTYDIGLFTLLLRSALLPVSNEHLLTATSIKMNKWLKEIKNKNQIHLL
jgi:hypothetical protein